MIIFSPAKINLGLQVLERRSDGFHNLQSLMYPTGLCDILEIHQREGDPDLHFKQSGIRFEKDLEQNLCVEAWKLFSEAFTLPPLSMHLHKQIPVGAGLGGGSSNASATLMGLNQLIGEKLHLEELARMSSRLGSDCPYFLHKGAMLMEGRGEILTRIPLRLDTYYLVLIFPGIHISTAKAYAGIRPAHPELFIQELIQYRVDQWKELMKNDFEESLFESYPLLAELKNQLYGSGAVYASLSGSGSALYGLFPGKPVLPDKIRKYLIWQGPA